MQFSKITSLFALIKIISAATIPTDVPTELPTESFPANNSTDIPAGSFSDFPSGTANPSGNSPQDGKNGTQLGFGGELLNGTIPDFGGEHFNGTIPEFGGEHLNATHFEFGGEPLNGTSFEHPGNFTHPPEVKGNHTEDAPKGGFPFSGTLLTALPSASA